MRNYCRMTCALQMRMTLSGRRASHTPSTHILRTPRLLLMIQMDELANEMHQANLSGSTIEHPNWRRCVSRTNRNVLNDAVVRQQINAFILAGRRR